MADRSKKEATPPPLLLMPAGGGLTLTPPDQQSLFMPVVQSEPSLFGPEDDILGEADSFVGQSPPPPTVRPMTAPPVSGHREGPQTANLFANTGSSPADPFTQINQGLPGRPSPGVTPPFSQGSGTGPLAPTSHVPASSHMSAMPPMPNASGLSGLYRKHGSSRYAPMPTGTYANSQSSFIANPPAPIPFSPDFNSSSSHRADPGPPSIPAIPAQPSMGPLPGMGYVPNATGVYAPVSPHWCFCKKVEGRDVWYPLSMSDNLTLEDAFNTGQANLVVPIEGGRYDVNLSERKRYSVYWEEDPRLVRRCSWFYKREGDTRYTPYEENMCLKLEEEYKTAISSGVWHKPIRLESGETVVMHNANVMVHYVASSQPDEWGNLQVSAINTSQTDQPRPRVVKRGVGDFDIDKGESRQVDHLLFVVHGIGTTCDLRFRSIIECVDDFRSTSHSLLSSHFTQAVESNRIGRVEFIPIQWHMAVHGDATSIDKRIKQITLPSIPKLRHFVNDTVTDVLFYTSPTYCQRLVDTVGNEINRLYELFLSRNPAFQGGVSVAGHSLGSCILFDLLQHQGDQSEAMFESVEQPTNREADSQSDTSKEITPEIESTSSSVDEPCDETVTLADLLVKVGLQEKVELFEQEQIDLESLSMCSESDLKELGLGMGPRKKLLGLVREEANKKDKSRQQQVQREAQEAARVALQQQQQLLQQQQQEQRPATGSSSSMSVDYIVGEGGTGQPHIKYPQLKFSPVSCFAIGSPMGLILSARGVETIGEDFRLPTCQKYFNVFHPFDPVAYRLEPLINPSVVNVKPVLMPHHKGRKRLHLELKESLARMGTDIKQKIIDSLKTTWTSINNFARAHQSDESLESHVDAEMSQMAQQLDDDNVSIVSGAEEEVYIGQLNEGRRVDYVLQERPIESFNDYMFSLTSHGCYWTSEDTVLLVLREIYSLFGISPIIPGAEHSQKSVVGPPPKGPPPMGTSYGAPASRSQPQVGPPFTTGHGPPQGPRYGSNMEVTNNVRPSVPMHGSSHMYNPGSGPMSGPPQVNLNSNVPPPSGPPPFSVGQSRSAPPAMAGPPPMAGFMKKT
ncbi:phospholipase DDHD2-like isoform X1 [Mya arenaria]|uniref:phospholipase DDHD2-like isoform X1 n=1 Tax=Mya arenaria TaxID=6604 RepID=UPI0022DFA89A|nr:phospholipase DDHD2-like isoform X1 [Mya arenaria]